MMSIIIKLIALISISDAFSKGQVIISWTVDDYGKIYIDGVEGDSSGGWGDPLQASVPAFTKVIGFYCRDNGIAAGLIASYSSGWSTTDRQYWRCTSAYENKWMNLDFDDSGWEVPVFKGSYGDYPWNRVLPGIASTAKWIWTSNSARTIYCRHSIYKQSPEFSFHKDLCDTYYNVSGLGSFSSDCTMDEITQDIWYRFNENLSETCDQIPNRGSFANMFLNGKHPTNSSSDPETRIVCLNDGSSCCSSNHSVQVKMCADVADNFFVYKFENGPDCNVSYCLDADLHFAKQLGNCSFNFPQMISSPQLRGPVGPADPLTGTFNFFCDVQYPEVNEDDGARFEVNWYFNGTMDPKCTQHVSSTGPLVSNLNEIRFKGHVGKNVTCGVKTYWFGSTTRSPESMSKTSYWVGIKATIPNDAINGKDEETAVKLEATVPMTGFGCEGLIQNNFPDFCRFQFGIKYNPFDLMPKSHLLQCYAVFRPGAQITYINMSITDMTMHAMIPQHAEIHFNQFSTIDTISNSIWDNYIISPISVKLGNDKAIGKCSSVTDPHYTSFDGNYFHIYEPGNFLLVKSNSGRIFEVHSHLRKCQRNPKAACNCGVAVREGNVVIGVDNCRHLRASFRIFKKVLNSDEQAGGTITPNSAGTEMTITMPSGAKLVASNDNNWHLNVYVYLPSIDFGKTEGLCGTWDNNPKNDLQIRNTQTIVNMPWNKRPTGFTESFRLPPTKSFFDGTPECQNTQIQKTNFCTCKKTNDPDETQEVECNSHDQDFFDSQVDDVCNLAVSLGRKKRQTNALTGFFDGFSDLKPDQNFTAMGDLFWPTTSGITEQQAKDQCMTVIKKSEVFSHCQGISNFNISTILEQCKEDILIADNLQVAESVLNVFETNCIDVAQQNVVIGSSNESSSNILVSTIKNKICLNHCSGRGTCINSTCVCSSGYFGSDCSVSFGTIPLITQVYNYGLCDINEQSCTRFKVTAAQVTLSTTCQWKLENKSSSKENLYHTRSSIITKEKTFCQTPEMNFGALNQFQLRITLDGQTYSKHSLVVMYNSSCVRCINPYDCVIKAGWCIINNQCYNKLVCEEYITTQSTSTTNTAVIASVTSILTLLIVIIVIVMVAVCTQKAKIKAKVSKPMDDVKGVHEITKPDAENQDKLDMFLADQYNWSSVAPISTTFDFNKLRPKTGVRRNNLLEPLEK